MKNLLALFCGTVFGLGLAFSGMTDTAKVLGFLDVLGAWVPDLAFVMGGAVVLWLFIPEDVKKAIRETYFNSP